MRLILYNPQKINLFGKTVQDWLTRGKVPAKYEYFQKYIREKKAIIYCDEFGSSLGFLRRFRLIIKIVNIIEIYLWLWINKINPFNAEIIFNSKKIRHDDILFSITHVFLDNEGEASKKLINLSCVKISHLSHYMFFPSTIAENVERGGAHFLIAENNLSNNSLFFKKCFPNYSKDVYTLLFCYKNRFKKVTPFSSRKNKCLATGSTQTIAIQEKAFREMYEFYKVDTFHPMRKIIYYKRHELTDYIDSFISHINDDTKHALSKLKKPSGFILKKMYIKFYNYYVSNFLGNYARRSYYDFDIVQKYNEYKMFIVPEEVVDLPAIGFVEGMACGCAYIGIKSDMYRDIGMIDGIHYIGYENNLNSLLDVIKYYQTHNDKLEIIANNGYNFAIKHFNIDAIAKTFLDDIERLHNNVVQNNYQLERIEFESSFLFNHDNK